MTDRTPADDLADAMRAIVDKPDSIDTGEGFHLLDAIWKFCLKPGNTGVNSAVVMDLVKELDRLRGIALAALARYDASKAEPDPDRSDVVPLDVALTRDFYRCPNTGEWVYKWTDDRLAIKGDPTTCTCPADGCPRHDASKAEATDTHTLIDGAVWKLGREWEVCLTGDPDPGTGRRNAVLIPVDVSGVTGGWRVPLRPYECPVCGALNDCAHDGPDPEPQPIELRREACCPEPQPTDGPDEHQHDAAYSGGKWACACGAELRLGQWVEPARGPQLSDEDVAMLRDDADEWEISECPQRAARLRALAARIEEGRYGDAEPQPTNGPDVGATFLNFRPEDEPQPTVPVDRDEGFGSSAARPVPPNPGQTVPVDQDGER